MSYTLISAAKNDMNYMFVKDYVDAKICCLGGIPPLSSQDRSFSAVLTVISSLLNMKMGIENASNMVNTGDTFRSV